MRSLVIRSETAARGGEEGPKRLLVVGGGFAGLWAALAAARVAERHAEGPARLCIDLIAPDAGLVVRPRLYEADPAGMTAPIDDLLRAVNVNLTQGRVAAVRSRDRAVDLDVGEGRTAQPFDRLVLATGSRLARPPNGGVADHGFSIDQLDEAIALDAHLQTLAQKPACAARDTVVVVGAGFTGIELAAEMPTRLSAIMASTSQFRVVVIERAPVVGPELGSGPRGVIADALQSLGVEVRLGAEVVAVDGDGLRLSSGERLDTQTIIWTAGVKANLPLNDLSASVDGLGRVRVDRNLRVADSPEVFMAGDVACAATDAAAPAAMMSCQHAMAMGRAAGHNAASELLGGELLPYRQPRYVTCLDLGAWGAVFTEGWERDVKLDGAAAKAIKRHINTERIYPPVARAAALSAADPRLDQA